MDKVCGDDEIVRINVNFVFTDENKSTLTDKCAILSDFSPFQTIIRNRGTAPENDTRGGHYPGRPPEGQLNLIQNIIRVNTPR